MTSHTDDSLADLQFLLIIKHCNFVSKMSLNRQIGLKSVTKIQKSSKQYSLIFYHNWFFVTFFILLSLRHKFRLIRAHSNHICITLKAAFLSFQVQKPQFFPSRNIREREFVQ